MQHSNALLETLLNQISQNHAKAQSALAQASEDMETVKALLAARQQEALQALERTVRPVPDEPLEEEQRLRMFINPFAKNHHLSDEGKAFVRRCFELGMTTKAIAALLGVSEGAMKERRKDWKNGKI